MAHALEIDHELDVSQIEFIRSNMDAAQWGIEHLGQRLNAAGKREHRDGLKAAWVALADAKRAFQTAIEVGGKEGTQRLMDQLPEYES